MANIKSHLPDIVQHVVDSLVSTKASFTAYDVTSAVREGITLGEYEVEGLPFEDIGGKNTQRVEHEDVRDAVRALSTFILANDYESDYANGRTTYHPSSTATLLQPSSPAPDFIPHPLDPLSQYSPTAQNNPAFGGGVTYNATKIPPSNKKVTHSFNVRPGHVVRFMLPEDLTANEAARLSQWIATLSFEQPDSGDVLMRLMRHND